MIGEKVILCAYCSAVLFDENDASIEYKNVYIHDSRYLYDAYWFDIHNQVRCRSCDGVLGEQLCLNNDLFYFIIWCGKIENEILEEDEMRLATQFLKCFAQVTYFICSHYILFIDHTPLPLFYFLIPGAARYERVSASEPAAKIELGMKNEKNYVHFFINFNFINLNKKIVSSPH